MSCWTSSESRPPAQRRRNDEPNLISASATRPAITHQRLLVVPAVASSAADDGSGGPPVAVPGAVDVEAGTSITVTAPADSGGCPAIVHRVRPIPGPRGPPAH